MDFNTKFVSINFEIGMNRQNVTDQQEKELLATLGIDSDDEMSSYLAGMKKLDADNIQQRTALINEIKSIIEEMLLKVGENNEQLVADAFLRALNASSSYSEFVDNLKAEAAAITGGGSEGDTDAQVQQLIKDLQKVI